MHPNDYQAQCKRTECDQKQALRRTVHPDKVVISSNTPVTEFTNKQEFSLVAIRSIHACLGMASEAGEVMQLLEKWIYYGQELDTTEIVNELGDLLWYVCEILNAFNLKLDDVMQANIAKLKARYPHKYEASKADRTQRDLAAERAAIEDANSTMIECPHCTGTGGDVSGDSGHTCVHCNGHGYLNKIGPTPTGKKPVRNQFIVVQDGHGFGHITDIDNDGNEM